MSNENMFVATRGESVLCVGTSAACFRFVLEDTFGATLYKNDYKFFVDSSDNSTTVIARPNAGLPPYYKEEVVYIRRARYVE